VNINPNIRKDDLGKFACRNEACSLHGLRGRGNIGVKSWSGRSKRFRQLRCKECGITFSENYGTPFYGIKTDREKIVQALRMVVERGSIRGAARAVGVDKDTIVDWIKKASKHSDAFSRYMLHDLRMSTVELDELWTTVKKSRSTSRKKMTMTKAR
jgi:transposase-like protein